jgi:flagellar hook capping protein FlgD
MKATFICSAVIGMCLLAASTAAAWSPGDNPGSGEITTPDTPNTAVLTTDLMTYAPGAPATLSGVGFLGGEGITLQVLHQDGSVATGSEHEPWRLAADQNGAFMTVWRVCTDDCVGKFVRAVAVGDVSGRSAEVFFADAPMAPPGPPPSTQPPPGDQPGSGEITTEDSPGVTTQLTADQLSYLPGTTATLLGAGFFPNEAVSVQVLHADGSPAEGVEHLPWRIAADQDGSFITSWRICSDDCVGKVVRAVAVGDLTGRTAEVHFADYTTIAAGSPAEPTAVLGQLGLSLRQNFPNPFDGSTTIRFTLPQRTAVSLRVFNLLGQEVATLATGTTEAGMHSVTWNGRGRDGRPAAPGIYFCRMEAGSFHQLRKMTLMR